MLYLYSIFFSNVVFTPPVKVGYLFAVQLSLSALLLGSFFRAFLLNCKIN